MSGVRLRLNLSQWDGAPQVATAVAGVMLHLLRFVICGDIRKCHCIVHLSCFPTLSMTIIGSARVVRSRITKQKKL